MSHTQPKPLIVPSGKAETRDGMPRMTEFIDALRVSFGTDMVNQMIRDGIESETFWAIENGFVIGSPPQREIDEYFRRKAHLSGEGGD